MHRCSFTNAALALASLLAPAAVIAFTLTLWSLGAELHLTTTKFFVTKGLLSHWQMWLYRRAALSFLRMVTEPVCAGY